jgi:hypothetical protein
MKWNREKTVLIGIALALALGLVLGMGGSGSALAAAQPTTPLKLTAFAINLGANRPAAKAGIVEIVIERWSSDAERSELLDALRLHGQDGLLKSLQENPRVGYIRTPDSLAWDLHYAHVSPDPGGGQRIFLATDRRIAFWESFNNTRSLNYPFTLVEMHLGPNGKGEGRMSIATKVVADSNGKFLHLEDFAAEPTRLQDVHAEKR